MTGGVPRQPLAGPAEPPHWRTIRTRVGPHAAMRHADARRGRRAIAPCGGRADAIGPLVQRQAKWIAVEGRRTAGGSPPPLQLAKTTCSLLLTTLLLMKSGCTVRVVVLS